MCWAGQACHGDWGGDNGAGRELELATKSIWPTELTEAGRGRKALSTLFRQSENRDCCWTEQVSVGRSIGKPLCWRGHQSGSWSVWSWFLQGSTLSSWAEEGLGNIACLPFLLQTEVPTIPAPLAHFLLLVNLSNCHHCVVSQQDQQNMPLSSPDAPALLGVCSA